MSPGLLNLTMPQGDTWSLLMTWKTSGGTPINLTGYTASMQLREDYESITAALTLTSGQGITLGGTAGTISISVSAATTAAIEALDYVYDLQLTSGAGEVTRLVQGQCTVTPEVTR